MKRISYFAIPAAATAVFIVSGLWHSNLLLGGFLKNIVVATVLAHFAVRFRICDWKGGMQLGLGMWIGFQAMLLIGTILHERMLWPLYVIHAGDAFSKTLPMSIILSTCLR
jgi:hypothetical protein